MAAFPKKCFKMIEHSDSTVEVRALEITSFAEVVYPLVTKMIENSNSNVKTHALKA